MASLNKVTLMGNLGADPEILSSQSGQFCKFRMATSERWQDKQSGEWREKAEWHNVVIYAERLVKRAEKYLKKGTTVYLEGALQTRKWKDKDDNDRWSTEVVLKMFGSELLVLSGGRRDEAGDEPVGGARGGPRRESAPRSQTDDYSDEVPF